MRLGDQTSDTQLLRQGGMAGVLGSVLLLVTFVIVIAFGLPDLADTDSLLRYPEIKTARIVENTLYLAALVLMMAHFLALYRTLRLTNLATSLFGSAVGILGLAVLICGALLHLATAPLSDLHRDTRPEDKATVVLVWQGVQSVFDTLLVTGALLVSVGLIALAMVLRRSPLFGAAIGWTGLALGIVGLLGSAVAVADPGSIAVAASVLSMLVFHAVVGIRSYRPRQ